jgi:hypothetical protein
MVYLKYQAGALNTQNFFFFFFLNKKKWLKEMTLICDRSVHGAGRIFAIFAPATQPCGFGKGHP